MPGVVRTRLQVNGLGSQSLPRKSQKVLAPHTVDLDIRRFIFTIARQLLDKLQPVPALPPQYMAVLDDIIHDRDAVCTKELQMNAEEGKQMLTEVMGGAALRDEFTNNKFLQKLQAVACYMRWLACSVLPDV